MRKATIFIALACLLVLCVTPVYASDVPPLPNAFYGEVYINGDPAPARTTTIEARGKGVLTDIEGNPITTSEQGKYGSTMSPELDLIVQGDLTRGSEISFVVNGIYVTDETGALVTRPFQPGETTPLDLFLVITAESITGEVEKTIPPGQTGVVDASDIADTTITVNTFVGFGEVTITVKKYYSNPHPEVSLPATMLPRYIDIEVDNLDAIAWPMYVKQTYTSDEVAGLVESSLRMYYFKEADSAWHICSDTGVDTAESPHFIWAKMTRNEVSGSPVAIGGSAAPVPPAPPVGGGRRAEPPTIDTNLFGVEWSFRISDDGEILTTIEATTEDGMLTIRVPAGIIALDKYGNPLDSLEAAVDESPPDPPEDAHIIGLAYDFGPKGATFDPAITLTWSYDPEALPEGVVEEDLVIACYVAGEWVELDCVVDTENNTITASVEHFTTFAIIGRWFAPAFTLSSLVISPTEVALGEKVSISISVANTGGIEGSYTTVLKINGVKEAEKSVTIAAGRKESVAFSVTRAEAGSYSVDVDGVSGSFTVLAPTPPPAPAPPPPAPPPPPPAPPELPEPAVNWFLIGGIIAAVILIGLLIFLRVRRRA